MTRKLKALGLALVAVFAMSAVAAQGASATSHHFEATKAPIDLTGEGHEGNQVFIGTGVEITCKKLSLTGTQETKEVTSVTLTPTYSECTSAVGAATVTNNGCNYTFTGETTNEPHTNKTVAPIDLVCNHTGNITLSSGGCTITFADTHAGVEGTVNQNLEGVVYKEVGTGEKHYLTAEAHVFTVKYIVGNQPNCALLKLKAGTHEDGTVRGNAIVKGYEHGKEHIEANQVGIKLKTTA